MSYAAASEIARLDAESRALAARASDESDAGAREYLEECASRAAAARDIVRDAASSSAPPEVARAVRRERASRLTVSRFRREYVAADVPVVIEGLGDALTEDGADGEACEWLLRRAGSKKVAVSRRDAHRDSTLKCEATDVLDLREYWDEVVERDDAPGSYLYDASVPLKLPSLSESVRVPAYFAHDYVQRTMRLTAFSRSWPSLFVAARGTRSSLHVDQWQGHFFMAMVRGTKRWTVFHRSSTPHLRPSWSRGTLDPAMPPLEEQEEMGMSPRATRWDVDLAPGEVLFVPGGAAHAVSNLDATVAFAGNFIDDTNLDRALFDLRLMGLKQGEQMMQSFTALDEVDFDDDEYEYDSSFEHDDASFDPESRVVRVEDYLAGRGLDVVRAAAAAAALKAAKRADVEV